MAKDRQSNRSSGGAETGSQDEGFLGRWSRRKAEARTEDDNAHVDLRDEQASVLPETDPELVDQQPAVVDPASLPDIDKMEAGSDFSIFMQAGVPQELKTKALRKLWRVKPELANLDGLIDYGEDLTGSFKVVDHLKSAYEVGKGFLTDDEDQPKKTSSAPEDETTDNRAIVEDEEKADEIDRTTEGDDIEKYAAKNDAPSVKKPKG